MISWCVNPDCTAEFRLLKASENEHQVIKQSGDWGSHAHSANY
jgi:hypothetical protein